MPMMNNPVPVPLFWSNSLGPHYAGQSHTVKRKRPPDFGKLRCSVVCPCKSISEHNFPMYRSKKERNQRNHYFIIVSIVKCLVLENLAITLRRLAASAAWMAKLNIFFQSASSSAFSAAVLSRVAKTAWKKSIFYLASN